MLQLGSAWWHLDSIDGMTGQINALSNVGLLGRFVGMLTDSRSLLSFSRHDFGLIHIAQFLRDHLIDWHPGLFLCHFFFFLELLYIFTLPF